MSVKDDVKAELKKLGIAFDENATVAVLKALLPKGDEVADEEDTDENGFVVKDPQVLLPKDLPLVITMPEGQGWKNPEQEAYAKVLNAAAYANPNWEKVKDVEIARLAEIGKDPSRYYFYTGEVKGATGNVSYNNKALG